MGEAVTRKVLAEKDNKTCVLIKVLSKWGAIFER